MNKSPTEASGVRSSRRLGFGDFEAWRIGVMRWVVITSALLVAYWALWLADRNVVATDHNGSYIAFEQSFPLADAWLLAALLLAGIQLWRCMPSALLWVLVAGGAGMYLYLMDVLYDLQHGIYAHGQGGAIELGINLVTAVSSVGIMAFGWHFRHQLLSSSTGR
jgi:hypothetical protein